MNKIDLIYSNNFRESDIMHMDLSALSDEDLQLFGIEDEATRREMLVKFSNLPNQAMHFDKFVLKPTYNVECNTSSID